MPGLGTIINTLAVVVSGVAGLFIGKLFNERLTSTLTHACGISTIFIGIAGAIEYMLELNDGTLSAGRSLFIVVTLVVGGLIGELINIEGLFDKFALWLRKLSKSEDDKNFIDAFVTCSITITFGAMAVIGAINDGIYHDYTILLTKTILDIVIVLVMTSSMGKGCIFSAISVFVFQGLITLLAVVIKPIMTDAALANMSLIGSILLFCIGINLLFGKKIRVANFLPALIIAVIIAFLPLGI